MDVSRLIVMAVMFVIVCIVLLVGARAMRGPRRREDDRFVRLTDTVLEDTKDMTPEQINEWHARVARRTNRH